MFYNIINIGTICCTDGYTFIIYGLFGKMWREKYLVCIYICKKNKQKKPLTIYGIMFIL